jgi:hypothetical protein
VSWLLGHSTVSQLSYVVLAAAILAPISVAERVSPTGVFAEGQELSSNPLFALFRGLVSAGVRGSAVRMAGRSPIKYAALVPDGDFAAQSN